MIEIKNINDSERLENNNKILGSFPELKNSRIRFNGSDNVLFCEEGVVLENSFISFNKNNSLIYLSKSRCNYKIKVSIHEKSVLAFGRDNYINDAVQIVLSEHKHFFVGSDGMFSTDIIIRNADAHLIYDINSMNRTNVTKSIFLGDHVWVGKGVYLSKGTKISSGAIIGANSLLSNKRVEHNSVYGGNPARKVKTDIFWNGCCVHPWDEERTNASLNYNTFLDTFFKNESPDRWVYSIEEDNMIKWDEMDLVFDKDDITEKIKFLKEVYDNNNKNRLCNN